MTQTQTQDHLVELAETLASGDRQVTEAVQAQLDGLHTADVARLIEGLPPERRDVVWTTLSDPQRMGEVLAEVPEGVREDLLTRTDAAALVNAVLTLDTDDAADLLPELQPEVVSEILFAMDRRARERLEAVRAYPEDTAGGLMDVDAVTVRQDITLEVVLRFLRRRDELPEHTNHLFVVDRDNRLVGTLLLRHLVGGNPQAAVTQTMAPDPIKFTALTPEAEVADAFERYDLVTAAVVDESDHLIGRITIDDVVDVIRERADHDVMARAGLDVEEDIFAPVAHSARNRALWLGVNLVTALIASWVISRFEHAINQLVALAVLMPIVASMGGNAGTQTLTIVIRGLALGTITSTNAGRVLKKELMVGGLNGLLWAAVVALVAMAWFQNFFLGLIIAAAMIINLLTSALAGVLLPLTFRRLGIDPALAGGVALTTITDVIGFLAFLGLAAMFLV